MSTCMEFHVEPPGSLAKVAEVAKYLSLSRSTVYQLMESGRLPYIKLGKCRRVRWEDVESLVAQSRISRS
jgi:excisionase family DNA binding protein